MKTYIVLTAEKVNSPGSWTTVLVDEYQYEEYVYGDQEGGNFTNDGFFGPDCQNAQVVGTVEVDSDDMDIGVLPTSFTS